MLGAQHAAPLQDWGAAVFDVGALEGAGYLQEEILVGDGADELKADGKASGGETAGD
jgi:hypothetical protein